MYCIVNNICIIFIAAVSPCQYSYAETLSTLRYASRAKNIINKPKINEVRITVGDLRPLKFTF